MFFGMAEAVGPTTVSQAESWPHLVRAAIDASLPITATVLASVVAICCMVAYLTYRRAMTEGREWAFFWWKIGAPQQNRSGLSTEVSATSEEAKEGRDFESHRKDGVHGPVLAAWDGVASLTSTIIDLATCREEDLGEQEDFLLYALIECTQQKPGVTRRASILKAAEVQVDDIQDVVLRVHRGWPAHLFELETEFSRRQFRETGYGLCWKAAFAGAAECSQSEKKRRLVPGFYGVADIDDEQDAFLAIPGGRKFQSILMSPILWEGSVLGVVCLDSEEKRFYSTIDERLVVVAARSLAIGWLCRRHKKDTKVLVDP